MIYISHAFGGDPKNAAEVEEIIKKLVHENPNLTFVSPIHTFGFLYSAVKYDEGMEMCLDLLSKCVGMYVYGEVSKGVAIEIQYCKEHGILYTFMK